jgi:hypothetical protein
MYVPFNDFMNRFVRDNPAQAHTVPRELPIISEGSVRGAQSVNNTLTSVLKTSNTTSQHIINLAKEVDIYYNLKK